jgi:hypothetical protein
MGSGSGEVRTPIRERGRTTAWPGGKENMQEKYVRGNGPYKGPSGPVEWVTGHKGDVVRTGKEIYGEKMDGIT